MPTRPDYEPVWVLYQDNWWPAFVLNAQEGEQPRTEEEGGGEEEEGEPHEFVVFYEDNTGMKVPSSDLCDFSWEDEPKVNNPAIQIGLETLRSQLAAQQAAAEAGEGEQEGTDAAEAKRLKKEEKKRRKEEKESKKKEKEERKREKEERKRRKRERHGEEGEGEGEGEAAAEHAKELEGLEDELADRWGAGVLESEDEDAGAPEPETMVAYEDRGAYGRTRYLGRSQFQRFGAEGGTGSKQPADLFLQQALHMRGSFAAIGDANNQWTEAFASIEENGTAGKAYLPMPRADFVKKCMAQAEQKERWKLLCDYEDDDESEAQVVGACPVLPVTVPERYRAPRIRTNASDDQVLEADTTFAPIRPVPAETTAISQFAGSSAANLAIMSSQQPGGSGTLSQLQGAASLGGAGAGGSATLLSLHETPGVMTRWLSIRDEVAQPAEDIHAVSAYGSIPKLFDAPQQTLVEDVVRYSAKLADAEGSVARRRSTVGGLDTLTSVSDLVPRPSAAAAGGLDLKEFTFDQSRYLEEQGGAVSEMPSGASAEVSSVYQEAAEHAADPVDFEDPKRFTVDSMDYTLPASAWHAPASEPYPAGSGSGVGPSSRPYSSRQSSMSRASGASRRGTDSWRTAAARIICSELTPFLRGTCGKPVLIESQEAFSKLARTLTDRALERKMHRLGQAVSLVPVDQQRQQEPLVFSEQDDHSLRQGVRKYMTLRQRGSVRAGGSSTHRHSAPLVS